MNWVHCLCYLKKSLVKQFLYIFDFLELRKSQFVFKFRNSKPQCQNRVEILFCILKGLMLYFSSPHPPPYIEMNLLHRSSLPLWPESTALRTWSANTSQMCKVIALLFSIRRVTRAWRCIRRIRIFARTYFPMQKEKLNRATHRVK